MRRSGIFVSVLVAGCIKAGGATPPGPSLSPDSGLADGSGVADGRGGGGGGGNADGGGAGDGGGGLADGSGTADGSGLADGSGVADGSSVADGEVVADGGASDGPGGGGGDQGGTGTDAGMAACEPGSPSMRIADSEGFPIAKLAVDDTYVYWVVPPAGRLSGFYRAPKGGGEATLFSGVNNFNCCDGVDADLTVDGDGLFIAEGGRNGASDTAGTVGRFDSGGNYTQVASGDRYPCGWAGHPRRVSTDPSRIYWIEGVGFRRVNEQGPTCDFDKLRGSFHLRSVSKRGGDARGPVRVPSLNMAVSGGFVYFTEGTTLYRLPADGGALQPVATGLMLDALASDGDEIYVGGQDASVYAVDPGRGTVRNVAGPSGAGDDRVYQFAFDERYVYWASVGGGGGIRRALKSGGPSELILPGGATTLALDERYLYYLQGASVWRHCK